jgi:hypothetical protein
MGVRVDETTAAPSQIERTPLHMPTSLHAHLRMIGALVATRSRSKRWEPLGSLSQPNPGAALGPGSTR